MRRFVSVILLSLAAALHAAITPPDPARPPFTAKEVAQGYRDHVIIARPLVSAAALQTEEARQGVRVRETFPRLGDLRVIELDDADNADAAIARLRATGLYAFVEPDYIRQIAVTPNDPSYASGALWSLNNTGLANGIVGADIDAAAAWNIIREAPDVVVAVVDTGVNLQHQDIAANLWTNPNPTAQNDIHGANFVGGRGLMVSGDPDDDDGHGSHVAGTIGAIGDNNLAATGIAWRVKIMAVKVFPAGQQGASSDILAGVNYAIARGAHIINASYGGQGNIGFSNADLTAISAARDAGVIFVAAAGNDGANMDITRYYPASYAVDNIVSVGNSTRRDEVSLDSNFGAAVDLFAPGSEIVSLSHTSNTGTATKSGTSMAAPHVSGALALLKAAYPDDDYRQTINRLLRGAEIGARFVGRSHTGGRLNVLHALTSVSSGPFNDGFAERPRLNTENVALRASNTGASPDVGEPAHAGTAARASIWWEWVAPITGAVSITTAGSVYDTVLAVYVGDSLATLGAIASNDDSSDSTRTSRVTFNAQAGTAYQIAVDGKSGQAGLTLLNLGVTPVNDAFAGAIALNGVSTRVSAANLNASRESGEPRILGFQGGLSLWYRWTAPHTGRFQIAAVSRDFDPLLGVFTGSAVNALTYVAESAGTSETGSLCTLNATAGTTYAIVVDTRSAAQPGRVTLTVTDSLWQASTGDSITGSAAVGADGTIYIGSTDNSLHAFAPNGAKKWSAPTSGLIDTCSPAIADDGTVYVSSNDGRLHAFTPSGTFKWWHDFGAPVSNSPAVAADGTIYVKAGDGYLYALDPDDGATKWRYDIKAPLTYASPSIAADGTVYQGSEDRKLYALNPDGTLKWTFTADNDIYTVPAIDAAGNIYFGVLNSGRLYSVTPAGALRWVYTGASLGSSSSPALSADGSTVYFAGYDSKLHAVNTASGAARWTYALGDEVRGSSPAVDAAGVIYVGSYDYKLYAVNSDGTLKRTYDTGNWIRSSPTIFGTTLYVGSNDNKLYAFDLGVGAAGGPWPQYRQNVRRLGRALAAPVFTGQPASQAVAAGGTVSFSATASAGAALQWRHDGTAIAGATGTTHAIANVQPANAGLYTAVATTSSEVASLPAILGVNTGEAVIGTGSVVGPNIVHSNGNTYDQVLLQGGAATISADPGEVARISFVDLSDDIVQVEFSGAGSLTVVMENPSAPAVAANYNQPNVNYVKGHAGIVIAGADATTYVSIFSVGRVTAINQSLFRDDVAYDGMADIAYLAIQSTDGKFASVLTGNTSFVNTKGVAGIYAPGVQFSGPVRIGNIAASLAAAPMIMLGSATAVEINGGDLLQPNSRAIQVSGIGRLTFGDNADSHGNPQPAQPNRGRLESGGVDVTDSIVVPPAP